LFCVFGYVTAGAAFVSSGPEFCGGGTPDSSLKLAGIGAGVCVFAATYFVLRTRRCE
jgi:hypothetical protein